jgi:putative two-component system hydrogenase maturation factor HypX/HoxX
MQPKSCCAKFPVRTKRRGREAEEAGKPLAAYRAEELVRTRLNFYGFDPSYHATRSPSHALL